MMTDVFKRILGDPKHAGKHENIMTIVGMPVTRRIEKEELCRQEIALWNLLHDVDIESFTELRVGWIGYITQHSSGVCK